ncbi:MAG: Eco57I restriction-modification methylase domain-containing protein [Pirellulaceae bacterium]|nr:Eco57I restriction-modification methylase domain-containing protein [Pirellulaceae bacterium]
MAAPADLITLVEQFRENRETYLSDAFNETALRLQFIDPMFAMLGWDIYNRQGYAEAYKDVVHEDSLKIGVSTKAPDYSFRTGGARKFFVAAQKPAVKIKQDAAPAFQLRRYAWSARLPLSILTNFEEFAVYDGRVRPEKSDSPSTARTLYVTFDQYEDRWDEIAAVFSREAVLKGSFDRYAESTKKKRGTAEVDAAFLDEIETWRSELARNLALRNPGLSQRELHVAVQKTIDRIIFLRMCEDRGIEMYGRLQPMLNGPKVYARLSELFREADDRYNSGLFHFSPEKGRHESPDEWTLGLTIDDAVLKEIIRKLYYPESPYEFSVLGADILGQVYEQFLGKVIRLTPGHRAVVEDKPEVKKAGGVYYTPTYIVEYIVKNTVGKLLEGKTAFEAAGRTPTWKPAKGGRPLRALDPACGSGSFLIVAYQHLLDWYRDWFVADDPSRHKDRIYQTKQGQWRLTTVERKRILLDHIYGVDIDPQAVEVTKLSLLLKVLEAENKESIELQRRLFHQRALPDLADNIKCGDSLIGPDFYQGKQLDLFDEDERLRINVFDWQSEFSQIMKPGGFDAVIGNPPYIRIQAMKEWAPVEVEFYKKCYSAASQGNYDIYVVFVERGVSLLNAAGRLGFILPHKFFNAEYGGPIREMLSRGRHLAHIVHFGAQQVFPRATTYTCLLFLDKSGSRQCDFVSVPDLAAWIQTGAGVRGDIVAEKINGVVWNFTVGEGANLVERLKGMPAKLGDLADIFVGLQTSADDVFIMDFVSQTSRTLRLRSRSLDAEVTLERELFHPLVSGEDVQGYEPLPERQFILFPYELSDAGVRLLPLEEIEDRWPKTAKYLQQNRKQLEDREKGRMKRGDWHGYIYLKNMKRQGHVKICVPRLVDRLCAGWDGDGSHFLDNVDVGGVTLKPAYTNADLRYLLALLNSKLLGWFFPHVSAPFRGNWMSANRQFLSQLPIPVIKGSNADDQSRHDRLVKMAEQMLTLHKQYAASRTQQDQTALSRQIAATAAQIDRLVYELYGLTDDEIRLVEASTTAVAKHGTP